MEILKLLITPLGTINKKTLMVLIFTEIIFALLFWQLTAGELIPAPGKVGHSVIAIISSTNFWDNLFSSLSLTFQGMGYSIIISIIISYLALIPLFRPIADFVIKCRYLTLAGLVFLFTLLTDNGHQLKISLLIFGIVPFFTTSLLSVFDSINVQEYELCTTLRMNRWQTLWEVIILGRLDQVFEVMRQNFAISWMMITMVEGLNMSEGGLGTMLIKSNKYIDLGQVFGLLSIVLLIGIMFDFLLGQMRYWLFPYAKIQTLK